MDANKICFIWNSEKNNYLDSSLNYVNELNIPQNYTIEKVVINSSNTAQGYNEAIIKTNAKYKVYLSEGLFILNKNFIYGILDIFKDTSVGMIGMVGCKTIPTSGLWFQSKNKTGKLLVNNQLKTYTENYTDAFEGVIIIDGSIMITQYDISWRSDIFTDKYFYDSAQCVEFKKFGYKVVVPIQNEPWCLLNSFNTDYKLFNKSRKIFLNEYYKALFPLVSILIPAYNQVEFFETALNSAIEQTYKNIEIIVCDDSTDDNIKNLLEKYYLYKYEYLSYYKNNGPLGKKGLLNIKKCFQLSKGAYVNYLLQDDIFSVDKIEIMMNYYIEYKNISLVTSYRKRINSEGYFLDDIASNQKLFNSPTIVDGISFGRYILESTINFIGELTTVLFKKEDIENDICSLLGRERRSAGDRAMWLALLLKGNAVYIDKPLSYFRIHENQNTNDKELILEGYLDLFYDIVDCYNNQAFISEKSSYIRALSLWLKGFENVKTFSSLYVDLIAELQECEVYARNTISMTM